VRLGGISMNKLDVHGSGLPGMPWPQISARRRPIEVKLSGRDLRQQEVGQRLMDLHDRVRSRWWKM
jgi:hypothetical protein